MTGLVAFDPKQMPAHIAAYNADPANKNIVDALRVPSLTYAGSRWALNLGTSEPKQIQVRIGGELVPIPVFKAIILAYAPRRSRAFYEGTYDKENVKAPVCWSNDGVKPDASIAHPQNKTCNGCKKAAQNSRIGDNGKGSVACGQRRSLALIPPTKLENFPVLRCQIAITSDFDGRSPDQEAEGWYAFSNYVRHLADNGVNNTALVITKMKFDPSENYPKILFAWDGWVPAEALPRIDELAKDEATKQLLITNYTTTAGGDDDAPPEAAEEHPKVATAEQQAKAAAASAKAAETARAAAAAAAAAKKTPPVDPAVAAKAAADRAKADKIAAAKAALAAAEAEAQAAEAAEAVVAATPEDDGLGGVLDGDVVIPGTPAATAADNARPASPPAATAAKKTTGKKAEPVATAPAATSSALDAVMGEWE